jgi:hypothetical protein
MKYVINLQLPACWSGSSIGIATELRSGRSGIEFRWDKIFRPSRPALEPTQPPVQWEPGLSRGKVQAGALLTTHPLLLPQSWKSRAITLPTLWVTPGR